MIVSRLVKPSSFNTCYVLHAVGRIDSFHASLASSVPWYDQHGEWEGFHLVYHEPETGYIKRSATLASTIADQVVSMWHF